MNDRVTFESDYEPEFVCDLAAQILKAVVAASRCTDDADVIAFRSAETAEALLQTLALTLSLDDSADLHTIDQLAERLRRLTREAAEHQDIVARIFRNADIVGGRE